MALPDQSTPVIVPHNRLLAALPPEEFDKLRPGLDLVDLELRTVLHRADDAIASVYFLESGWCSVLASMQDGDSAEVGLIGPEGLVGLPVLLGEDSSELEVMVQQPGRALRLGTAAFREALDSLPAFRTLLLRYALAHHLQVARSAACNGRHQIGQRLARWLLMAHDRAQSDTYAMTHEFMSMMLGVRRAGVTVAAGVLQRAGMIRYGGGRITIEDRPGLEASSCRCYAASRRAQDRLFAPAAITAG